MSLDPTFHYNDTRLWRWKRILAQTQINQGGGFASNNPQKSDTLRITRAKVLRALNGVAAGGQTCCPPSGGPTPPPPSFSNALASFYKTCTGGIYNGTAACKTVNAGIFTSEVSQLDADTQARYAAFIAMNASPPGPCCNGNSYLGGGGWVNYSVPDNGVTLNGRTAIWTWNDTGGVLNFDLEMVADAGRPDTNQAVGIVMHWDYCNSWPTYNFHIHVDYTWNTLAINGIGNGVGLSALYANGSLTATPILSQPIGTSGSASYDVSFPAGAGADSIDIDVSLGNSFTDHGASGSFNGTMTITPLIPPTYVTPTCTVMSVKPSPFNYALRPANDDFANAIVLSGANGSLTFDNTYASLEPNEPLLANNFECDCDGWYKWTAPSTGTVTFDPAGSTLVDDPVIVVYTGTALTNLVKIVEKNQTSPPFSWIATGGTTYYWRIGGFFDDKGTTHLAWSLV